MRAVRRFDEFQGRSHKVYPCGAARAVLKGHANDVTMSVEYARRLRGRGIVAGQSADVELSREDAFDARADSCFRAVFRGLWIGGRPSACPSWAGARA